MKENKPQALFGCIICKCEQKIKSDNAPDMLKEVQGGTLTISRGDESEAVGLVCKRCTDLLLRGCYPVAVECVSCRKVGIALISACEEEHLDEFECGYCTENVAVDVDGKKVDLNKI